jgi:hemin uptake protein HemP
MMDFDLHNRPAPAAEPAVADAPAADCTPRRVLSEHLIGPAREVLIRHAGCDYRLRITRQGKLILTK